MSNLYTHKYLIHLSYLGTNFSGWQIQDNTPTIQGIIMECLNNLLDFSIPLIVGAGRTDTGVHAVNYFAHFDSFELNLLDLKFKMNRFLPADIVIHNIILINSNFHARYSALSRKYEYWISTKKDPFLINRSYLLHKELDFKLMNTGAEMLIGKKNFSSFSKSKLNNNMCIVESAYWFKSKDMLIFSIEANRFLHNMVRSIVGTLINLGENKINLEELSHIIDSEDRTNAGYSVPACGLYLLNIKYPKIFNLESI